METSTARRRARAPGDRRTVLLPDGTSLVVRPLRRWQRDALAAGFARLSPESRRARFLTSVNRLSDAMLTRLVDDVDGVHHVAAVGYVHGRPVAVARIARLASDSTVGDIAVTVMDEWQGRGIGSALAAEVVRRTPGLVRLETLVAADNPASLRMLAGLGPLTARVHSGVYDVTVDLASGPRSPELPMATAIGVGDGHDDSAALRPTAGATEPISAAANPAQSDRPGAPGSQPDAAPDPVTGHLVVPSFESAQGPVTLNVGDDVTVEVRDPSVEGGVRRVMGQVTAIREEDAAVWVRGLRVDLADAVVADRVASDDPSNMTAPPTT